MGARAAARGVTLDVRATEPTPVLGDDARLRQVVRNLLDNAITHTPAGGTIEVRTAVQGGDALVSVADSGPGIPAEHSALIFERFYRVDPARTRATGGAGLGLAIARQLVEAHRGSIIIAPSEGRGARFEVRLPLAPADVPAPSVTRS